MSCWLDAMTLVAFSNLHSTTPVYNISFRLLLGWEEKQSGNLAWEISSQTHYL